MNGSLIVALFLGGFVPNDSLDDVTESSRIGLSASWGEITYSTAERHLDPQWSEVLQPGPATAHAEYGWDKFETLIPSDTTKVGEVFELPFDAVRPFLEQIHPAPRADNHMDNQMDQLLEQMHPAPREEDLYRVGYPGVYGVLMERSEHRLDVLLRAHVEFELRPDEIFFMISQFEGRLIADPTQKRVLAFSLQAPLRTYNYDVHIRDGENFLIDIGCIKEMGVRGGAEEELAREPSTMETARTSLRRAFYPFARLDWFEFAEGFEESRKQDKPLHLITIFGSLDDESC